VLYQVKPTTNRSKSQGLVSEQLNFLLCSEAELMFLHLISNLQFVLKERLFQGHAVL
jgi:hypothetical protein